MTKFEVRNNMAYASQMQFEVLRRALCHNKQNLKPSFDWKFWEKAARDPKMTTYLNQGVKRRRMCETTPFVNTVGTQYIAARAKIELAWDSIREQGPALSTCIGLADGVIHPASDCDNHIAKPLAHRCVQHLEHHGSANYSIFIRPVSANSSTSSSSFFLQILSPRCHQ